MLYHRQRQLLLMLDSLGGAASCLDFQNLLLLWSHEHKTPPYDFIPHRLGGFSFTTYADKKSLIQKEALEDREDCWIITNGGRSLISGSTSHSVRDSAEDFVVRHRDLSGEV